MTHQSQADSALPLQEQAVEAIVLRQCINVDAKGSSITIATPALNAAHQLARIVRLGDRILREKEPAFTTQEAVSARAGSLQKLKTESLGVELIRALGIDIEEIRSEFPEHKFHPSARLMLAALDAGQRKLRGLNNLAEGAIGGRARYYKERQSIAREVWTSLIHASRTPEYRSECQRLYKAMWKREQSTKDLIKDTFKQRSRVLAVRVDLRYRHFFDEVPHDPSRPGHPSYSEACSHRDRLLDILRDKVFLTCFYRYILRMEWAPRTGFHFHLLVLLEGRKIKDGIGIGELIGRVWNTQVTDGQGFHFNCNLHAIRGNYPVRGTGVFERHDNEGIKGLIGVATYLCKTDYYISYYCQDGGRTFFRSEIANDE